MRLIVCGGRFYDDAAEVARRLGAIHARHGITLLIHGGAPGADRLAGRWAEERGIPTRAYPADWRKWDRAAGPIRNAAMLRVEKPDAVVVFPGGIGTKNMIDLAEKAGVPVWRE
jgi:predicted Rossmann-fold nucleotide-binding protein